jgi:hypothetical protein
MDKSLYKRYTPDWDNETRLTLATTIGKTPPPDDDTLVTKRSKSKSSSYSSSQSSFTSSQPSYYSSQASSQNSDMDIQFGGFTSASHVYNYRFSSDPSPKRAKKESKVGSLFTQYAHQSHSVRKSSNVSNKSSMYSPKASKKATTVISTAKATTAKDQSPVKTEPVNKSLPVKIKTESDTSTVVKTEK